MKQLLQYNIIKKSSRVELLCNQTAWQVTTKKYSFELLIQKGALKKVFIPEHGFFGESQPGIAKYVKEKTPEFVWREGKYEALNDKKAVELLVGDKLILDYYDYKTTWEKVKAKFQDEEAAWIKEASPFLIYKPSLQQLKIK